MKRRLFFWLSGSLLAFAAVAAVLLQTEPGFAIGTWMWGKLRGGYTVEERLRLHGAAVERRVRDSFVSAGLPYPPAELAYLAFKDTAVLEVYGREAGSTPWKRVLSYPVLGMSGTLGPKLRQGDGQVPEGIYRAEFLNPNSRFHLAIRLDYPNAFDRARAQADGRMQPGSDIMIHGSDVSIGCLAMGNQAAEDLFILAALAGKAQVSIVVAPTDFRRAEGREGRIPQGAPPWVRELYRNIKAALSRFPNEIPPGGLAGE